MSHICSVCLHVFKQKRHLDVHSARKTPCVRSAEVSDIIKQEAEKLLATEDTFEKIDIFEWTSSMLSLPDIVMPCVRWSGSKKDLLNEVIGMFPRQINSYYEPFVGGGSVLLALLAHKRAGTITVKGAIHASDSNGPLIEMYKHIQKNVEFLIHKLTAIENGYMGDVDARESYYYAMRNVYNEFSEEKKRSVSGAAHFIFLNRTCFRGLYWENKSGFNVPYGHYKKVPIYNADHLRDISSLIREVIFTHSSYKDSLTSVREGDFVYMDPPYVPSINEAREFVSYRTSEFTSNQHTELFAAVHQLKGRGVTCLLSNSNAARVISAFPDDVYTIKRVVPTRSNSKDQSDTSVELLIRN